MIFSAFILDADGAQIESWQFNFDKTGLKDLALAISNLQINHEEDENDDDDIIPV